MDVGERQGWVEFGENFQSQRNEGKGDFYWMFVVKVRRRSRVVKGGELFQIDKREVFFFLGEVRERKWVLRIGVREQRQNSKFSWKFVGRRYGRIVGCFRLGFFLGIQRMLILFAMKEVCRFMSQKGFFYLICYSKLSLFILQYINLKCKFMKNQLNLKIFFSLVVNFKFGDIFSGFIVMLKLNDILSFQFGIL